MRSEKMKATESLTCTFCGRQVHVAADMDTQRMNVLHGMPPCPDFEQMDADAYLAYIRENQQSIT